MKTRIITSVVALAILAAVLVSPPLVFYIALGAVILVMLYECYTSAKAPRTVMAAGFLSAVAMMGAVYESVYYVEPIWNNSYLIASVLFTVLLHMGVTVAEHGKTDYRTVLSSGFLTMYITLSMSCIALTKSVFGTSIMLIIFIGAWMTDTGAYFTGKAFGKHKLIPHVSPNKTVEGSVGGVVISILSCVLYLFIYTKWIIGGTGNGHWPMLVIGGVVIGSVAAILAQLGDLAASAIKRDTGIKDFGWIFPGHGGFMDRFDSVLYISPVIYFLLQLFIA